MKSQPIHIKFGSIFVAILLLVTQSLFAYTPAFQALPAPSKTVFHIQDIHLNHEAQSSIHQMVENLVKKEKVNLLALEGVFREIEFKKYWDFPYQKLMKLAANVFLEKQEISGAVHAALVMGRRDLRVVGVDDQKQYEINRLALLDSYDQSTEKKNILHSLKTELAAKKEHEFNPRLFKMDQTITQFRAGLMDIGPFVQFLSTTKINLPSSLLHFLSAYDIELNLKPQTVQREQSRLIEKLVTKLNPVEASEIIKKARAVKSGDTKDVLFYKYLLSLALDKNLRLEKYPALMQYVRYIQAAHGMNMKRIIDDTDKSIEYVYQKYITTPLEKELVEISEFIFLSEKTHSARINPITVEFLQAN